MSNDCDKKTEQNVELKQL